MRDKLERSARRPKILLAVVLCSSKGMQLYSPQSHFLSKSLYHTLSNISLLVKICSGYTFSTSLTDPSVKLIASPFQQPHTYIVNQNLCYSASCLHVCLPLLNYSRFLRASKFRVNQSTFHIMLNIELNSSLVLLRFRNLSDSVLTLLMAQLNTYQTSLQ